jgi:hypothetical protein
MSEDNLKDVPASKPEERLGRRLFFFKAAAVIGVAAATVAGTTTEAEAQWCTDRDPYDPRGRGRWCRRRRYCTDRDPYDARGRGIRC